ncbi:hypothetical protein JCM3774_006884 [Rhodotorula dairenensis]
MGIGCRPATPGTIVVLLATILLVLVSVSVPVTKTFYFLKANITADVQGIDIAGTVTLGCWGYCIGDNCTPAKLGYNLDILKLFGENGNIAGVSNAVLKWITYLLILHPIAAALAALSTIMGLVAHLRGFGATCFTTCIASLAATVALLAFVFDIVVFLIAKKRIESAASGESAELGNAIWMTLAAMILLLTSGFFFGCGACIFRRQRQEKQVADLYRPQIDTNYGSKMRNDAYAANARPISGESNNNLPAFAEYDHESEKGLEQIPLTRPQAQYSPTPPPPGGAGGYGYDGGYAGYNDNWQQTSPTRPNQQLRFASQSGGDIAGTGVGAGAGARLAAEARAQRGLATRDDLRLLDPAAASSGGGGSGTGPDPYHVEPFNGMYDQDGAGAVGGYGGYPDDDNTTSYAANPYYTQSQQQEDAAFGPQSPTRLAGPRAPSAGLASALSPISASEAGYPSYPPAPSTARQPEPPVLPYRESSTDHYGYPAGATPYYAQPDQNLQQQQQQEYHASDQIYGGHDRYQSQATHSTDMYGAPVRY